MAEALHIFLESIPLIIYRDNSQSIDSMPKIETIYVNQTMHGKSAYVSNFRLGSNVYGSNLTKNDLYNLLYTEGEALGRPSAMDLS